MEFARARRRSRAVSIIPMIDVAMFLLIFFMVAGVVEKIEIIPVAPPMAESGKLVDEGHIVILLGTHGELVMGDDLVTEEQLESRVRELVQNNPNKVITLKADANIAAVRMIAAMDRIKLAGGRNLSIVTQSKGDEHAKR